MRTTVCLGMMMVLLGAALAEENKPMIDWSAVPANGTANGVYASRTQGARDAHLRANGGSEETEAAVLRTLRWLKDCQAEDGSWDGMGPTGSRNAAKTPCTAFALLTFLGHGETHDSEEFGETVKGAVEHLISNQKADGRFLNVDGHEYAHPIAAYALCEAYSMMPAPVLKEAAEKAVSLIVKGQNDAGGWNYNLRRDARNDTSYMGWCSQAVKAAELAKLDVEGLDIACGKAVDGFRKNAHPEGGFGYTVPSSTHGLTGVGVYCMTMLGESASPEVKKGLSVIKERSSVSWSEPKGKIYYWYYDTAAIFRSGGPMWKEWNAQFAPEMVKNQVVRKGEGADDKDIGFWESPAGVKTFCPRIIDTCLCALSLQVYYRYTPSFAKEK